MPVIQVTNFAISLYFTSACN